MTHQKQTTRVVFVTACFGQREIKTFLASQVKYDFMTRVIMIIAHNWEANGLIARYKNRIKNM